jgi:hypothetical protein
MKKEIRKSKKALDESYNQLKDYQGTKYTGMQIGRSHNWYYDKGPWKEKKISPDLWEFNYNVTKRRKGKAPMGSGVPLGTEYHWYIVAHQNVRKLDANSYSTAMRGYKYKLAHKRADKEKWSATYRGQRKRLIKFFEGILQYLKKEEEEETKAKKKVVKKSMSEKKAKVKT